MSVEVCISVNATINTIVSQIDQRYIFCLFTPHTRKNRYISTNLLPTGLWTINLTIEAITSVLY